MRFVRAIWKLLVGIKDALVLLVHAVVLWGTLRRPVVQACSRSARASWQFDLDGSDRRAAGPAPHSRKLREAPPGGSTNIGFRDLIAALDEARDDGRVKAVALDLDGFLGGGQAAMSDLSDALRRGALARESR